MTGKFVHADADWKRVSLSRSGAVPYANEVWRVHHLPKPEEEGITYVALQNVAYGRYLSFSINRAERGGFRATQMNRSQADGGDGLALETYPWMWRVERLPPPTRTASACATPPATSTPTASTSSARRTHASPSSW